MTNHEEYKAYYNCYGRWPKHENELNEWRDLVECFDQTFSSFEDGFVFGIASNIRETLLKLEMERYANEVYYTVLGLYFREKEKTDE